MASEGEIKKLAISKEKYQKFIFQFKSNSHIEYDDIYNNFPQKNQNFMKLRSLYLSG